MPSERLGREPADAKGEERARDGVVERAAKERPRLAIRVAQMAMLAPSRGVGATIATNLAAVVAARLRVCRRDDAL